MREEAARISWQTRILAQYTAAGYMIEKGKPNEGLEQAKTLGYDDIERAMLSAPRKPTNKKGSYERLAGYFGTGGLIGKRRG